MEHDESLLELFNIDLSESLGIHRVPAARHAEITARLRDVAQRRLRRDILACLSDEDRAEFTRIWSDRARARDFLQTRVPDVEIRAAEVLKQLRCDVGEWQNRVTRLIENLKQAH